MCIGVCSVKCQNGCTNCASNCTLWCDITCTRTCYAECDRMCLRTCSSSCATFLSSESNTTSGPERDPTADGYIYPHPKNRWEERESFRLLRDIGRSDIPKKKLVTITFDKDRNLLVIYRGEDAEYLDGVWTGYIAKQTTVSGGVYAINTETGEITIDNDMLSATRNENKPNLDNGSEVFIIILFKRENVTFNDIETRLPFGFETLGLVRDKSENIVVIIRRDLFEDEGDE